MLAAQDKDQVLKWSKRQLGKQARLVSISEKDISEAEGFVEREGTGITAREAECCQPLLSIMENYSQQTPGAQASRLETDGNVDCSKLKGMSPTVH